MKKKILLVLVAVLVIIQFIRPAKNQSNGVPPTDISQVYTVPDNVSLILKKACRDCHSNNTVYPWYWNIQPVAWWLNDHIEEGKGKLNFSEFANYSLSKQYHRLEDINDEVEKKDMPLTSYTWLHANARLTDTERETLINWSKEIRNTMKAKYPADSLIKKEPRPKQD